jgi:4-amino-4-deoxy-L-arabinose transferase-like glycosyltransferase
VIASSRQGFSDLPSVAAFLAALLLCAVPLFLGLDRYDMANDEAIYSYAVHRLLETGDWLNPRSIPDDGLFTEKPPLKLWLVAGVMKLGLVPVTDAGMRAWDPVFGAGIFAYVFLLGRRLGGAVCGLASAFTLFMIEPFVFEHSVRSNNMEGALTLAYVGGLYHSMRWLESPAGSAPRHVWAVAGYLWLGFMTKFVAIAFVPIVAAMAGLWRTEGRPTLRQVWAEWWRPAIVAVAAAAPWFLYQTVKRGRLFFDDIFGSHVVRRFTVSLDPEHVQPWYYYPVRTWQVLGESEVAWFVAAGAVLLVWRAVARRDWNARVYLVWWVLPVTTISLGSSKLFHYLFPFLPPLALAGGLAVSTLTAWARKMVGFVPSPDVSRLAGVGWFGRPGVRGIALAVGILAAVVGLWTFFAGRLVLSAGDVVLLRNNSALRPLALAVTLFALAGRTRWILETAVVVAIVWLLPVRLYAERVVSTLDVDRPLAAFEACARRQIASGLVEPGLLAAIEGESVSHTYYYHLRHLGPWERVQGDLLTDRLTGHMSAKGRVPPVLARPAAWSAARERLAVSVEGQAVLSRLTGAWPLSPDLVLVVPPDYGQCSLEAARQSARWSGAPLP